LNDLVKQIWKFRVLNSKFTKWTCCFTQLINAVLVASRWADKYFIMKKRQSIKQTSIPLLNFHFLAKYKKQFVSKLWVLITFLSHFK
jgi:hypothetical protein